MKWIPLLAMAVTLLTSCDNKTTSPAAAAGEKSPISGTWKLISAKKIEKGDTTITGPVDGLETIKIFNDSYFAFFTHDLKHGADSATAAYSSGSGTYTLVGDTYSEHLEYCSARGWENQDFSFKMTHVKDTILQSGIEKIDSLNIDHVIVETYVRIR